MRPRSLERCLFQYFDSYVFRMRLLDRMLAAATRCNQPAQPRARRQAKPAAARASAAAGGGKNSTAVPDPTISGHRPGLQSNTVRSQRVMTESNPTLQEAPPAPEPAGRAGAAGQNCSSCSSDEFHDAVRGSPPAQRAGPSAAQGGSNP